MVFVQLLQFNFGVDCEVIDDHFSFQQDIPTQNLTRIGENVCQDRRSKAIRALEAGLQARWKAVVHEMSEAGSGRRQSAETKLLDALETVTVRSVVGLRGLTEVPREVESVALAVLTLVSSLRQLRFRHVDMAWICWGARGVTLRNNANSSR